MPRKNGHDDLENRISEYEPDLAFVNFHQVDWSDEECSAYAEGHPLWELSMVPIEHYDGIMYIAYLEE